MTVPDPVDAVFGALADRTRRELFRQVVARAPVTATELADDLPISRQAVAKHLGVLRDAGLVEVERAGREARFAARTERLDPVARWVEETGRAWTSRLDRLGRRVAEKEARRRD